MGKNGRFGWWGNAVLLQALEKGASGNSKGDGEVAQPFYQLVGGVLIE